MVPAEPDDAMLARESRAGSLASFDRLVHRHHPKVFAFLLTLTKHRQDAEDLTQETFVRAWKKIDRYDPSLPILPWLLTIARRLSIDMLRKRKPIPAIEADPVLLPPAPSAGPDLWRTAERHLSPDAFSALWLHYRDELPLAEVGRILGKKEGAVKVMLHRARKSLAEHLRHQPAPPPPLPQRPPPLPSIWNNARVTS
ncbi:hypothetical protein HAHE_09170 [Haloferula helveola]|uniref:RNA polymerase sigma factor n=1 Tax=Haloferula helveola TaxID=490095 RepID=A0ABM7RDV5_9BACT|nr:hypothetical protein HAHE_09170 [Haloferula helveola]